jgi:hypothetical protein
MSRNVCVNLSVNLYMTINDSSDRSHEDVMDDIMANLDYDFALIREGKDAADIDDMEIVDWNIVTDAQP